MLVNTLYISRGKDNYWIVDFNGICVQHNLTGLFEETRRLFTWALRSRPSYIWSWSFGIMDCMLFTFENRDPLMR